MVVEQGRVTLLVYVSYFTCQSECIWPQLRCDGVWPLDYGM